MIESNILAGDIGGTKTNLAIFSSKAGRRTPLAEETFQSREYPNLEKLALDFIARTHLPIAKASFCVSGPVVDGKARITNLPWVVDRSKLAVALGLPSVSLSNDLLAFAQAVPYLKREDIHTLNSGCPSDKGTLLVVAPGTGLGQAYLNWSGSRYYAHPSEGGHADFAPTNDLEIGLLRYLLKRLDHVSYERVCSGMGLPDIYNYLKEIGVAPEPRWLAEKIAGGNNPTVVISDAALDVEQPAELCRKTLELFVSVLGAVAGNAALHTMALGGVYLGGGIPPRILSFLEQDLFMRAFTGKGRFSDLLAGIPVHVILNPKIALLGAASLVMD